MTKEEIEKRELSKTPLITAEIVRLDYPDIARINDKALKKLASTLVSSTNKRIRRLLNAAPRGISESALRKGGVLVNKLGEKNPDEVDVRFFSIEGKTRNQILREVRRMTKFQEMKTSTVKGAIDVRKMNERNVFGETREERVKREKTLERKVKQLERVMKFKKNQSPEKQAELQAELKSVIEKYSVPKGSETLDEKARRLSDEISKSYNETGIIGDTLLVYNFLRDNPDLSEDDILSAVFKFYRQYEENHSAIVNDYGSDKILRAVGAYVGGIKQQIATRDELTVLLNQEMPDVIQREWELLPNQEEAEEEFFAAFERHQKLGTPILSEEDGWR